MEKGNFKINLLTKLNFNHYGYVPMETALVDLFSGKLHHKFTGYRLRHCMLVEEGDE